MRAAISRSRASASDPAGAVSPPSPMTVALAIFVVESGWATLQLSR